MIDFRMSECSLKINISLWGYGAGEGWWWVGIWVGVVGRMTMYQFWDGRRGSVKRHTHCSLSLSGSGPDLGRPREKALVAARMRESMSNV